MIYRKATEKDIEKLIELRKKQLVNDSCQTNINIDVELKIFFKKGFKLGSFFSWIAEEDNKIIAASEICSFETPPSYSNPSGKIAYLTNVYTENKYRCKGIALALLKLIILEAKEKKYTFIRLNPFKNDTRIYQKLGFKFSKQFIEITI
ncbi:GNAT family N-acetyltransferase [Clostridium felsineum]|uniref:GNAT family N-acetyltransferase n=1 Tax=Clostridium felsineum TaxID=36839 RepID=UPI00214D9F2A|nr:GNAT family N-acetyltransferase [Clostridium felsineum]MCR3760915.1 GNAT family N-acetyltransferase [Clostridium felsineum]